MRGRKRKTPSQQKLAGFPGHRRRPKPIDASPSAAFDEVPPELAHCPLAAAEWRRLVPVLRQQRTLLETDRAALIAVCLEWDRYLAAATQMARDGATVRGSRGRVRLAPELSIANKALVQCQRLWEPLGMTPASRARLGIQATAEDDPFSEFDDHIPLAPPKTQ